LVPLLLLPKLSDRSIATLQIPFLLSLAGIFADYLPAFPFAERPTICLADKLDQAFAILLSQDRDPALAVATDTSHHLVSVTDRVRIRSVIESTRIIAVEASAKKPASASGGSQDVSENFTDTDYDDFTPDSHRHDRDSLNMSISKIYEGSLSILGDSLG
jgi:Subunit 11 of the general transcription factor TFIIH